MKKDTPKSVQEAVFNIISITRDRTYYKKGKDKSVIKVTKTVPVIIHKRGEIIK